MPTLLLASALVLTTASMAGASPTPAPPGAEEIPPSSARVQTFEHRDGSLTKRISERPLNYRAADGSWRPIDTTLRRGDRAFRTAAGNVRVRIPTRAASSDGVAVTTTEGSVEFRLRGGTGSASVAEDTATFGSVLPATTSIVTALPEGVKEVLHLKGPSAPTSAIYDLDLSSGLIPKTTDTGAIEIADREGKTQFVIPPAFGWVGDSPDVQTSPRSVPLRLSRSSNAWVIAVDLGASWIREALQSDQGVFVDPTVVQPGISGSCGINNTGTGATDPNYNSNNLSCLFNQFGVGQRFDGKLNTSRGLLRFDVSSIPADALVTSGQLSLKKLGETKPFGATQPVTASTYQARPLTAGFGAGASWLLRQTGGALWATPGGDAEAAPAGQTRFGQLTGRFNIDVAPAVRRWIAGALPNNGLLIQTDPNDSGNTNSIGSGSVNAAVADRPVLDVRYVRDTTPPEITLSESMATPEDARDAQKAGSTTLVLDVKVTDGSTATEDTRQSGVRDVSFSFDGQEFQQASSPSSCFDSCSIDLPQLESDTDALTAGNHNLKVVAFDRLGRRSEKTWTIPVLDVNTYKTDLATWKSAVEQQIDAVLPAVPLTGPMPTIPTQFETGAACVQTQTAVEACDRAAVQWGDTLRTWFNANLGGVAQTLSALPDLPRYLYARDNMYSARFVDSLRSQFDIVRTNASSPTDVLNLAITLARPVSLATLQTLIAPIANLQTTTTAFRGTFGGGEQPVVSVWESEAAGTIAAKADAFYSSTAETTAAAIDGLQTPNPEEDADDLAASAVEVTRLQGMQSALNARDPFVTGLTLKVSVVDLLSSGLPNLLGIAGLDVLKVGDDPSLALLNSATGTEFVRTAPSSLLRAAPFSNTETCDDRNEANGIPKVVTRDSPQLNQYMPSRHRFRVQRIGSPNSNGLNPKRIATDWRWVAGGSLRYFCGAKEGKRFYEEDVRALIDSSNPWTGNWDFKRPMVTNLPKPGYDDLAEGMPLNRTFSVGDYSDFSYVTGQARRFRYGQKYFSVMHTTPGKSNTGTAYVSGSALVDPRTAREIGYCSISAAAKRYKYLPWGSCSFLRKIACVGKTTLGASEFAYVRRDFADGPPAGCTYPVTG